MELDDLKSAYPNAGMFKFGDNKEICQELLSLVSLGKKRATCSALRDYESEDELIPEIGSRDIALNWDGTPALVIETTAVAITRFCDVDEAFALAEGENETLEGWQIGHRRFFERNGGFDPEMKLVCERFNVVADLTLAE